MLEGKVETIKNDEIGKLLEEPEKYMVQAGGEYEIISELGFLRSLNRYRGDKYIIYGAGQRCRFLLWWLEMENVSIECIIDRDPQKNNTSVRGKTVYSFESIPKEIELEKITALISVESFVYSPEEILLPLYDIGTRRHIYPFDEKYGLPDYRYEWSDYYYKHKDELTEVYYSLYDDESRKTMFEFIKMNITNCAYRGYHRKSNKKYNECFVALEDECYLNVGGYVGDNVFSFIEIRNEVFEKIVVVEADSGIYKRLLSNLEILPEYLRQKIVTRNVLMNEEVGEKEYKSEKITLISMDIEGAELSVICGLKKCIQKNRPVLAICAYHKAEDIIRLPEIVNSIVMDYKIYFRKYAPSYNSQLRSGELVMYAVPVERCIYSEEN